MYIRVQGFPCQQACGVVMVSIVRDQLNLGYYLTEVLRINSHKRVSELGFEDHDLRQK